MAKIKNIIIFSVIATIFILIYIFFIKPSPDENADTLISFTSGPVMPGAEEFGQTSTVSGDFLSLLLSVKNIRLDDAIFSDSAFISLRDSSITLIPDGNEGRPNPFAPLGTDIASAVTAPTTAPTGPIDSTSPTGTSPSGPTPSTPPTGPSPTSPTLPTSPASNPLNQI